MCQSANVLICVCVFAPCMFDFNSFVTYIQEEIPHQTELPHFSRDFQTICTYQTNKTEKIQSTCTIKPIYPHSNWIQINLLIYLDVDAKVRQTKTRSLAPVS